MKMIREQILYGSHYFLGLCPTAAPGSLLEPPPCSELRYTAFIYHKVGVGASQSTKASNVVLSDDLNYRAYSGHSC